MLALKEFPEIEASAGTMLAPYQFGSSNSGYEWRGRRIEFGVAEVTDEFKDVLGLQVVEGRWFGREDDGQTYEAGRDQPGHARATCSARAGLGQNIDNDRTPDGTPKTEPPQRVVGVVAAYREDGEFDGERNYVLFRKTMRGAQRRPPNSSASRPSPPREPADQGAARARRPRSRSG